MDASLLPGKIKRNFCPCEVAMPLDAPFKLGPFSVHEGGRLSPGGPEEVPSFRVTWRGRVVHLRISPGEAEAPDGQTQGTLSLQVALGRVPSTADVGPAHPAVREHVFATIDGLPTALPSGWRLALLADHRVALAAEASLLLPASAGDLVTAVTLFLLELAPYLDLLDESGMGGAWAGLAAPSAAFGTTMTWPG